MPYFMQWVFLHIGKKSKPAADPRNIIGSAILLVSLYIKLTEHGQELVDIYGDLMKGIQNVASRGGASGVARVSAPLEKFEPPP